MEVTVKMKYLGKRKLFLTDAAYTLPDGITSIRQLLEAMVSQEVNDHNAPDANRRLVEFLTEEEIGDAAATGKVSFGRLIPSRKADRAKAVDTAIQGFQDGLFRVVVGTEEVTELDAPIHIKEAASLTFIRLTFLAGRLW
jgi:hypothetical protein